MAAASAEEVRYHLLRPAEVVARRTACPVVYIPIGTLEWHGPHNPLGADTLQAEGLACRCAREGGGLVFPPLYFGESRLEGLMEANAADRADICGEMGLPPENFLPDAQPFSASEQVERYHGLLVHILAEAASLGFHLGVLVAGHYPLIDHARSVVHRWHQFRPARKRPLGRGGMLAWALVDYLLVQDQFAGAGDHAAGWETSHLLHLCPDRVDLAALPPKGEPLIGVGGAMAPQDADAAFGEKTLAASAAVAIREVRDRLDNPAHYRQHGCCFDEGRWRAEKG